MKWTKMHLSKVAIGSAVTPLGKYKPCLLSETSFNFIHTDIYKRSPLSTCPFFKPKYPIYKGPQKLEDWEHQRQWQLPS